MDVAGSGPLMASLLGYARVSITLQDPALQVDALKAAGCYAVYTDVASGATTARPQLEQVLGDLRPGTVWWCGAWTGSAGRCATD